MNNREKAFNIFFGDIQPITESVVITPISKIYEQIKKDYSLIRETRGWWQKMEIKIVKKPSLILKVPPGSNIMDCLNAISLNGVKRVIFLGFCGSLSKRIKIGKIVSPATAFFGNKKPISFPYLDKKYKIVTTPQLLLNLTVLKKLKKRKIDFVDMESYFFYRWAQKNNISLALPIFIVTDQPLYLPFFDCGKKETTLINKAVDRVSKMIK